jgi:lactoylglutathione lyase
MLRVSNLDKSLAFYTTHLGMKLLRREEHEGGRFTLAFLGYESEATCTVIELTHNWDPETYEKGTAYGHIALAVKDIHLACEKMAAANIPITLHPKIITLSQPATIAFIEDPDGYKIELIEQ